MQPIFDDLARIIALPAEDWQAIAEQGERIAQALRTLDALPLAGTEPATVYQFEPGPPRSNP